MERGRGEGDEELCEAGREASSAGMVLGGHRGCHRLVESFRDESWAFLLPASTGFLELEGQRLPSWAGRHLRAGGRDVGCSEKWKAKRF